MTRAPLTPAETQARAALTEHATTGRLPEGEGRAFIAGYLAALSQPQPDPTPCPCHQVTTWGKP